LLTAMMDPLPVIEQLKQVNSQIVKPQGSNRPNTCAEFHTQIDRWIFCFEGSHGLLTSGFFRGYDAEFGDFKSFADKRVARLILIDPEPGTTIQARITELAELHQIDESLFAVLQATPERERIRSVKVEESTVRGLALSSTEISWPTVGGGPTTGKCAVYISADRAGHIREVWPEDCDNAGLQDPLRDIVKKWQLKPAAGHGAAVQIEALVTFTFDAKVVNDGLAPKPPDAEAEPHTQVREPLMVQPRVTKMVKPDCSLGQSCHGKHGEVFVVVDVLSDGKAGDISVRSGDPQLFDDAIKAARQCLFEPGILLGKPTRMTYVLKYQF
jgi:TonB-like protein